MLKKAALRRIILASLALLILLIIYFFPNDTYEIEENLTYIENTEMPIFLIDKNNYVARTSIIKNKEKTEDIITEIIDALTIDGSKSSYIPNNFKAIIPRKTKLLDFSLNDGLLKLNFNKNFLNIEKENEEKMIEALIFSLTELSDIQEIMIFVNGTKLNNLPNSKKKLPNTLTKDYGINKIYNLDSIKDTSKTTVYYLSKDNDFYYYVPVTEINNSNTERVEVIIKNLKSTPIYHTNLISYLTASTNLLNYELLENSISLSFDNALLANLKDEDIQEEVKYSIALSLRDTYNIKEVSFNIDNELISTFSL